MEIFWQNIFFLIWAILRIFFERNFLILGLVSYSPFFLRHPICRTILTKFKWWLNIHSLLPWDHDTMTIIYMVYCQDSVLGKRGELRYSLEMDIKRVLTVSQHDLGTGILRQNKAWQLGISRVTISNYNQNLTIVRIEKKIENCPYFHIFFP